LVVLGREESGGGEGVIAKRREEGRDCTVMTLDTPQTRKRGKKREREDSGPKRNEVEKKKKERSGFLYPRLANPKFLLYSTGKIERGRLSYVLSCYIIVRRGGGGIGRKEIDWKPKTLILVVQF